MNGTAFTPILLAAPAALFPLRVMAGVALVVVLGVFVWVLRHLRKVEDAIIADDLVPAESGARGNMMFIVCAVTFLIVALLLFLLIKA
jgi:hypothetical protein